MYGWAILATILSCLSAYCAKLSNTNVPYGSLYVFLVGLMNISLWMWVAKNSKNLLFDSVLYDVIITIIFTGTLIILKGGTSFDTTNWIGLALAMIGLLLMKA